MVNLWRVFAKQFCELIPMQSLDLAVFMFAFKYSSSARKAILSAALHPFAPSPAPSPKPVAGDRVLSQ